MADPRIGRSNLKNNDRFMTALADGVTITYSATTEGGSAVVGRAVTISSTSYTISTVADGEGVLGKLIQVEADGICTVQIGGFMTLPGGTGAALTAMKKFVGDLLVAAEGYIREVNTAAAAELGVCRGFIVDASVTTAVVVYLE